MMRSAASLRPVDIRLALGFVTLTLLAWLADALLRASLLTGTEFPDSLIVGGPIVLWMRGAILAALLIGWVGTQIEFNRRRETERRWRQSRALLNSGIEGVNSSIWEIDLRTGESWSGPGVSAVAGLPDGGASPVDIAARDLIPPVDRENWSRAYTDHLAGKTEQYSCEFRIRIRDGTYRWLLAKGKAIRDKNRVPIRLSGFSVDITPMKLVEQMAEKSQRDVLALIDESKASIFIASSREIVHANPAMAELLGFDNIDDLIGVPMANLIHPDDRRGTEQRIDTLRKGTAPAPATCRYLRKDGSTVAVDFSMTRVFGFGRGFAILATMRGPGADSRSENDLEDLRQRYDRALTATNDAVWETDLRQGDTVRSARWFEMLGYGEADLGRSHDPMLEMLHPDDRGQYEEVIRTHSRGQVELSSNEWRLRAKSGHYRWYQLRTRLIRDDAGQPIILSGSMTDVTERKAMGTELLRRAGEIANQDGPASSVDPTRRPCRHQRSRRGFPPGLRFRNHPGHRLQPGRHHLDRSGDRSRASTESAG